MNRATKILGMALFLVSLAGAPVFSQDGQPVQGHWVLSRVLENQDMTIHTEERGSIFSQEATYSHPYIYYRHHMQRFGIRADGERFGVRDWMIRTRTHWGELPRIILPGENYTLRVTSEFLHAESGSSGPATGCTTAVFGFRRSIPSVKELELRMNLSPPDFVLDYIYHYAISALDERLQGSVGSLDANGRWKSEHIRHPYTERALTVEREFILVYPEYTTGSPEIGFLVVVGDRHRAHRYLLYVYEWRYGEPEAGEYLPAISVAAEPRRVRPDGESSVEIVATLYEYVSGDRDSSQPLAGRRIDFTLNEQYGIHPGSLSAATAVTDANGQARVAFTAAPAELLARATQSVDRAIVTVRSAELQTEGTAYINYSPDRGRMWVEPNTGGIISDHGIVPPDSRFPALVTAHLEDDDLRPLVGEEVTFNITAENPHGLLRGPDGREGTTVTARTDGRGLAEVQYFYAAAEPPQAAIRETVEARSQHMIRPATAHISTGLFLTFENAESAYEGRGTVNAREEVPLRIRIRDEWHPGLDLPAVLTYWGLGGKAGDTRLHVKLEIENLGTVPVYLLDVLRTDRHGEAPYEELVDVRSFREHGVRNLLWIPEVSLRPYGYPRVRPPFTGENNYELRVSLVDSAGEPVFGSRHPRGTAFLGIPTDMPADAFSVFLLSNPLGPHTPEARLARLVLSTCSFKIGGANIGGFGLILALADAAHAINTGDTEALLEIAVSEIKGQVAGDIADGDGRWAGYFTAYNNLAIAEQYASFAMTTYEDQGFMAMVEDRVISEVAAAAAAAGQRLVVLYGDGTQALRATVPDRQTSSGTTSRRLQRFVRQVAPEVGEVLDQVSRTSANDPATVLLAVEENRFAHHDEHGVVSLKNGPVSLYLIPADLEVEPVNASRSKIY